MLPAVEGIVEIVGGLQNEPCAFIISQSTLPQNKYV